MYQYTDAVGIAVGPKPGGGILNAYFFVFFVWVGNFFFINLFVGVLFLNFEKAQRDEKEAMLLDGDEVKWVDMMKMICGERPEIIKIPKNPVRKWFYELIRDDGPFGNIIMACIILNIFTMAATFEGMSLAYSDMLDNINYFFTASFTIEMLCKMIALGGNYFNSGWNKFDFFVVSASYLDIVMANMSANSLKVIKVWSTTSKNHESHESEQTF
jgi:MFS family permease